MSCFRNPALSQGHKNNFPCILLKISKYIVLQCPRIDLSRITYILWHWNLLNSFPCGCPVVSAPYTESFHHRHTPHSVFMWLYSVVFCSLTVLGMSAVLQPLFLMLTLGLEVWVVKFRIVLVTPGSLHFQIYFRNVEAFLCFCRNYSQVL